MSPSPSPLLTICRHRALSQMSVQRMMYSSSCAVRWPNMFMFYLGRRVYTTVVRSKFEGSRKERVDNENITVLEPCASSSSDFVVEYSYCCCRGWRGVRLPLRYDRGGLTTVPHSDERHHDNQKQGAEPQFFNASVSFSFRDITMTSTSVSRMR